VLCLGGRVVFVLVVFLCVLVCGGGGWLFGALLVWADARVGVGVGGLFGGWVVGVVLVVPGCWGWVWVRMGAGMGVGFVGVVGRGFCGCEGCVYWVGLWVWVGCVVSWVCLGWGAGGVGGVCGFFFLLLCWGWGGGVFLVFRVFCWG